jgi:hypothetical protein
MKTSRRSIFKAFLLAPFAKFPPVKLKVEQAKLTTHPIASVDALYVDGKLVLPENYKIIDANGWYKVNWPPQSWLSRHPEVVTNEIQ